MTSQTTMTIDPIRMGCLRRCRLPTSRQIRLQSRPSARNWTPAVRAEPITRADHSWAGPVRHGDRLRNRIQRTKGRGRERLGRQTHDRSLASSGKADRYQGGAKEVGAKAKGVMREIRKTLKR